MNRMEVGISAVVCVAATIKCAAEEICALVLRVSIYSWSVNRKVWSPFSKRAMGTVLWQAEMQT